MFILGTHSPFPGPSLLQAAPFRPRNLARIAAAACIAAACSAAVPVPAAAATARTAGPKPPAWSPSRSIRVTNLRNAGTGSLRAAIRSADAGPPGTSAVIRFAVSGVITLASRLPAITRKVSINGTSAPAYADGGPPAVEIDANSRAGLQFAAGSAGSRLLGVAMDNASRNGVTLNAGAITLDKDYIGLDLAGDAFGNRGDGVYISAASSGNLIGLNNSADTGVVANVIAGNAGSGIVLSGSSRNTIVSNRIGTNAAGRKAIANGGDGVLLTGRSDGNEIGGTDFVDPATGQANDPTGDKGTVPPVFVVPPLGNLISGNAGDGVLIEAGSGAMS